MRATEVFGISTEIPKSYVSRDEVDGALSRCLLESNRHIAIHGSSKQGKTALRKRHFEPGDCTVVHCSPTKTVHKIFADIASAAGAAINFDDVIRHDSEVIRATIASQIFDISEAQSLCRLLESADDNRVIVLEDFHYLPRESRQRLAFDLKTFSDLGRRFLILGIWHDAEYLECFNNDLTDRITSIRVEPWLDEHFSEVARLGAEALTVSIDDDVVKQLILKANGNVGLFQSLMLELCNAHGVKESQLGQTMILSASHVRSAVDACVSSISMQLIRALQMFVSSSSTETTSLNLPFYLAQIVIDTPADEMKAGLSKLQIRDRIRKIHPRQGEKEIRLNDVAYLLGRLPTIQKESHLFHYDFQSGKLFLADSRFLLALSDGDKERLRQELAPPFDLY